MTSLPLPPTILRRTDFPDRHRSSALAFALFFFSLPISELVLEYNMWIVTFTRETSRMFIDINKKI
jgi:hypothetical protein